MKLIKVLSVFVCAAALIVGSAIAEDKGGQKLKEGGCCAKAKADGKECAHPCCAAATKDGKVCAKCNKAEKKAEKTEEKK